jgi:2-keto-4-pentenoate hydratase/2-oxohepta-3-ene-1,7-dioic acid hydratase in catechol pathway
VKLALFDDSRLGIVVDDRELCDVTDAIPAFDPDPLTAGWWRALCRDWPQLRERLTDAAASARRIPVDSVTLHAPVLNPSKVIAAASNYKAHVAEMHGVQERTLGGVEAWMMEFDVFLKAPSSITDPAGPIVLPPEVVAEGREIHHESELVVVIGTGGRDIPEEEALGHVFGYTIGLDITVRSPADRSRRKSYDTFSPMGPWIRVADEEFDAGELDILLTVDGEVRQTCNTRELITPVARIISYASRVMTLNPGDVIFTGAPPGVGPITAGEVLHTSISGIGEMWTPVR